MIADPLESDFIVSLTSEMDMQQWIIRAIIICSSTLIFILIGLLIKHFTKQITKPIEQLTEFTQQLKGADDFSAKKELIKEIREEKLFEKYRQ
jgi:nitrate/nitrite-specific signal transduction histidine kinase